MYRLTNNPVLTSYQIQILALFFATRLGRQFFLTGGTALAAFYLGHRKSQDLDLFTLEPFEALQLEKTIAEIARQTSTSIKTKVKTGEYYEVYLEHKKQGWVQRLDFVKEQPVVFGKKTTIDGVIVDSLENIASNKILTIYGRLEPKDYLDFYFISKETNLDFDQLFAQAKRKDSGLHEFYFANIVADVALLEQFPPTLKPFNRDDLVNFYLALSARLLKKIKPKEKLNQS